MNITVGEPFTVVTPSGGRAPVTHIHVQELPATVWTVEHNLGRYPAAVSVFDDDLAIQWSEFGILHIDTNSLYVTADIAITGKALVE